MASAQVSSPEPEEDVKVEEAQDEDATLESEVEKVDATKPVVEEKQEPFDVECEDEEGHGGITESTTDVGARVIRDDDDDELEREGEGDDE